VGSSQGPRFVAFYGCMFYAMMRPSEVTALVKTSCHLPGEGWGRLIFADASAPSRIRTCAHGSGGRCSLP
jgi:hypothetical protein